MALDIGYIGAASSDGLDVKVYYQTGFAPEPGQDAYDAPLVNGPRGYCLDVTNTTGRPVRVTVSGVGDIIRNVNVASGDPVTSGPGRSRTVSQVNSAGLLVRRDVQNLEIQ